MYNPAEGIRGSWHPDSVFLLCCFPWLCFPGGGDAFFPALRHGQLACTHLQGCGTFIAKLHKDPTCWMRAACPWEGVASSPRGTLGGGGSICSGPRKHLLSLGSHISKWLVSLFTSIARRLSIQWLPWNKYVESWNASLWIVFFYPLMSCHLSSSFTFQSYPSVSYMPFGKKLKTQIVIWQKAVSRRMMDQVLSRTGSFTARGKCLYFSSASSLQLRVLPGTWKEMKHSPYAQWLGHCMINRAKDDKSHNKLRGRRCC